MYDRGHKGIVAIACAGAFLAFLDATIVNIAFPDISRSFAGSGRDALSWVLDGYFVVIAALLVPAGGLADRFGHKRIFLLGVSGFTAASLLCALAPSLELPDRLPRHPRARRGDDRADLAGARARRLPARAPRRRRRYLGRRSSSGRGGGADPRRRPRRALRLAPRLPRQPAARRRRGVARRQGTARAPPARQPPARPPRRADAGPQPGPGHAGDRRGQRLGLDRDRDPRLLRRLRGSCSAA